MQVGELTAGMFVLGQNVAYAHEGANGYTVIEWDDGWTFGFPSDLDIDDMTEYLSENAG